MANVSTQVANRIKWARVVLGALAVHGDEVEQTLADTYDGVEDYDSAQIGETIRALSVRFKSVTELMEEVELALSAELADDDPKRDRRDRLIDRLREVLYGGRDSIEKAFGEAAVAAYGLDSQPPRQPDKLLTYTANVLNLLDANPRTETDIFDNEVSTAKIVDVVEGMLDQLEEALEDVETERREAQVARARRDAVVEEWERVYRGTAKALSGFFLLAGRDDLAERVRPTIRASTGHSEPSEEDLIDDESNED